MARANGITRQEILHSLKVEGSQTAEELARTLGISPVAVRQHLTSLEAEASVSVEIERRGQGRPAHRFHLTAQGDETFPRQYDTLANAILDELREWQGEDAVRELVMRSRERVRRTWQSRLACVHESDRVNELARMLSESGFMAEVREDAPGAYTLTKKNCAVCAVAKNHPEMCCNTSAAFYEQLLGDMRVEKRGTILSGSQSCEFSVRRCAEAPSTSPARP
jgi:DeoR family transcriptional regulator, suf operon transcriptional repressor